MALSIATIRNADYWTHASKVRGEAYPCIVCGRAAGRSPAYVRIHNGGDDVVTAAEAEELNANGRGMADCGSYPVGRDCLRQHPELLPYVNK